MFIAIALTIGLNGAGHRSSIAAGEIENAGAVRGDDNTGRDDYGMEEWDGEGRRRQMMHAVHADEEEDGGQAFPVRGALPSSALLLTPNTKRENPR